MASGKPQVNKGEGWYLDSVEKEHDVFVGASGYC